jgi:hypothetical protein
VPVDGQHFLLTVSRNDEIQEIVRKGQAKEDDEKEGNEKMGELLRWDWPRGRFKCRSIRSWDRGSGYVIVRV